MLYCKKCGTTVTGHPDMCPLCQGDLSGRSEGGSAYPTIKKGKSAFALALKILAMLTLAAVVVCGTINFSQYDSFNGWWLYVAGGVASFWVPFGLAVRARHNISKCIIFTTVVCCVIAFLWDLCLGYKGWSLDFFLPIACCVAMLAMAIIARALKLYIEQYIYYIILDIVFAIVPLVLLLCGVIDFIYPSVGCVAASAISLTALLIFQGKALRAEIVRRTHM